MNTEPLVTEQVDPVPNLPLLRKVLELVDSEPSRWDQAHWACRTECGTAFCIAGHVANLLGEVEWRGVVAGREGGWTGHDAIDRWRATDNVVRAAGLDPERWGMCPTCDATGGIEKYPGQRADAEAWQQEDPPTGDGWQLWETVSEGSPISPVFPDAEGLIDWLCSPAYTWGTSTPMQQDQAERFVRSGWAPSFIGTPATGIVPGEQLVGRVSS